MSTVEARTEAAIKLIESGMSRRQAAKALGVSDGTVRNDLRKNPVVAENPEKFRFKQKRAKIRCRTERQIAGLAKWKATMMERYGTLSSHATIGRTFA